MTFGDFTAFIISTSFKIDTYYIACACAYWVIVSIFPFILGTLTATSSEVFVLIPR
jgi:uncharacterized BrkB/YihY/UPF0761 family membrane protein